MNKIVFLVLFVCGINASAQKLDIVNGDFDFIKNEKSINVEFVYDNMTLLKKNLTNEQYIKEHSADLEEKGKNVKIWQKKWADAPEYIWEPKFIELMNRDFKEDHGIVFEKELSQSKYTLIVETVWLYPGWDASVMKQPAKVTTNLKFVETDNRGNVLVEVTSKDAPGNQWGSSFSDEDRLGEGYAKTGKSFAKLILKEAF